MNRIRQGFCEVANPFNPRQQRRVSLLPEDVNMLVFWTRWSAPMQGHLYALESRGYSFYFLYTITGYGAVLEPGLPETESQIMDFRSLCALIGRKRVIWRYDPVILSESQTPEDHRRRFEHLMQALSPYTDKVIISFLDIYQKTRNALQRVPAMRHFDDKNDDKIRETCTVLAEIAARYGMSIQQCAGSDLPQIKSGKCIDDKLVATLTGRKTDARKDAGQRRECTCIKSVDIGRYHTCGHGCIYCYATDPKRAASYRQSGHDPSRPAL